MTQKTLIADAVAPAKPRKVGECACDGKGWIPPEGGGWATRCTGCTWVSERHKRLAESLKKAAVNLEKLGGAPTEKQVADAEKIRERGWQASECKDLKQAIEREMESPLTGCECSRSYCECESEDDQ